MMTILVIIVKPGSLFYVHPHSSSQVVLYPLCLVSLRLKSKDSAETLKSISPMCSEMNSGTYSLGVLGLIP